MKTKITFTFLLLIVGIFSISATTEDENLFQNSQKKTRQYQAQFNGVNGFEGAVFEESIKGKRLANATVIFTSEDKKLTRKVISGRFGLYKIALPVARYYVTVIHAGHEKYTTSPGSFVVTKGKFSAGNFFLTKKPKKTYVPDNDFEQHLINLGYDNVLDDYVLTANIENITNFRFDNNFKGDFTGLEDFVGLKSLYLPIFKSYYTTTIDLSKMVSLESLEVNLYMANAPEISKNLNVKELIITGYDGGVEQILKSSNSQSLERLDIALTVIPHIDLSNYKVLKEISISKVGSINLSNCTALEKFECGKNLTSIDLTGCTALTSLNTGTESYFNSLNLSSCIALESLSIRINRQINHLGLGNNPNLKSITLDELNSLNSLNLKNGKPKNIKNLVIKNCRSLICVTVDDPAYSTTNWTNIDPQIVFKKNCNNTVKFKLYPNPFENEFTIDIQDDAKFELFTVNGEFIFNGELKVGVNYLDFLKLKKGVYYINIITENEVLTKQLVKN